MKAKVIEKGLDLGIDIPESKISTMDDIQTFTDILRKLPERSKNKPSGSVPLSRFQTGSSSEGEHSPEEGYDSVKDMILDVQARSSKENPNAPERAEMEKIRNEFWRGSIKAIKQGKQINSIQIPSNEDLEQGKTLKALYNESFRKNQLKKKEMKENE